MNAASRYTYFCTHSKFAAICELRGCIMQDYCAVYVREETCCRLIVICNNALGVTGSVMTNVFHCLRNVINDPDRNNRVQVFSRPVFLSQPASDNASTMPGSRRPAPA